MDNDDAESLPSFVKRSRPRAGAGLRSKVSLDAPAPASTSASSATAPSSPRHLLGVTSLGDDDHDHPRSRVSTPRAPAASAEEEDGPTVSSSVVFRARNRGAARTAGAANTTATTSKPAATKKKPISFSAALGDEDAELDGNGGGEAGFEIRRSKLAQNGKEARKKDRERDRQRLAAPNTLSLHQASISGEQQEAAEQPPSYSSSYLAELKASTPSLSRRPTGASATTIAGTEIQDPMAMQIEEDGIAKLRNYDDDANEASSLARVKFGSDFAHDGIPSESVIRAAKEKRARLRKEALERGGGEDFISLGGSSKASSSRALGRYGTDTSTDGYQGPHPHSRLQREEDEYGSGEEEYAEYTGATERIPIGKKAEREYRLQQRREMEEALADGRNDYPDASAAFPKDEVDTDEEEWERAQLRRTEMAPGLKQKQDERQKRDKSPYRPAEIPLTAPLPTMTSASARLTRKVKELEQSAAAHALIVLDAEKGLEALELGERENQAEVAEAESKESWFRELEGFVTSIAEFMQAKGAKIDEVERDCIETFVERTRLVQRARAKRMEDELALFWGVPTVSVLPPPPVPAATDAMQPDETATVEPSPTEDGDYTSPLRLARQADTTLAAQVESDALSPSDLAAFDIAQRQLSTRLTSVLSDVKAPEYLDAAARLPCSPSTLHPRSIVARFREWRRLYPLEYAQAWGGLAIASIWEFYARLEMTLFDLLGDDGKGLEDLRWHHEVATYSERDEREEGEQVGGGDEEVLMTVVQNVVVPHLTTLVEREAYDPWSKGQTKRMLKVVEEAAYVVDRNGMRFQTLLTTYLTLIRRHTRHLYTLLSSLPSLSAPSFHPSTPLSTQNFTSRLISTLLHNLIAWSRYVSPTWTTMRVELIDILDDLLGGIVWKLILRLKGTGGEEMASRTIHIVPDALWKRDVQVRFEAFVRNA